MDHCGIDIFLAILAQGRAGKQTFHIIQWDSDFKQPMVYPGPYPCWMVDPEVTGHLEKPVSHQCTFCQHIVRHFPDSWQLGWLDDKNKPLHTFLQMFNTKNNIQNIIEKSELCGVDFVAKIWRAELERFFPLLDPPETRSWGYPLGYSNTSDLRAFKNLFYLYRPEEIDDIIRNFEDETHDLALDNGSSRSVSLRQDMNTANTSREHPDFWSVVADSADLSSLSYGPVWVSGRSISPNHTSSAVDPSLSQFSDIQDTDFEFFGPEPPPEPLYYQNNTDMITNVTNQEQMDSSASFTSDDQMVTTANGTMNHVLKKRPHSQLFVSPSPMAIFIHAGAGYHSLQNESVHLAICSKYAPF